jgi:hypothetical protein
MFYGTVFNFTEIFSYDYTLIQKLHMLGSTNLPVYYDSYITDMLTTVDNDQIILYSDGTLI